MLQLQGRPTYEPPAQNQPGAAGHQIFRFRVAGDDGSDAVLQLGYSQPFDKKTPPAKTYRVVVHVRGGPGAVTVTEEQNGGMVTVPPGGTLRVRLPANPTTGYTWQIGAHDRKALKQIGLPQTERPNPNLPGAGGYQLFRFQVTAPEGSDTPLEHQYLRPFEKDKPPARTFKLTVHVGSGK
jgi:inhibitor of cysteine peptidase